MEISYTEEQQALKQELRAYYDNLLTPEVEAELAQSARRRARPCARWSSRWAADGWLGIGWPKEWGGQGRSAIEQFIFFDESMRSGAPGAHADHQHRGPDHHELRHAGAEGVLPAQDPGRGDPLLHRLHRAQLGHRPGLARPPGPCATATSTSSTAPKIFTSLASDADYIWLATRTDPNVAKHKGISMFLVPMDTPGIRVVPMKLLGDHDINYTFYEDVRVPATSLVGGENQGWTLITNQLNHERVTLCSPGIIERVLHDVRAWAQATKLPDGRRVIDQEWVQEHLARVYAELEFLRLINWKVAWQGTQGHLDVADASTIKVFGTEFYLRAFRSLMEIVGQAGYLTKGSPAAVIAGRLEMYARSMIILTFGGGTNEIQRDLIAIFGLGMPRSLR